MSSRLFATDPLSSLFSFFASEEMKRQNVWLSVFAYDMAQYKRPLVQIASCIATRGLTPLDVSECVWPCIRHF